MYFMIGSGEDGIWIDGPMRAEQVSEAIARWKRENERERPILEAIPTIDKGCFMADDNAVVILRGEIVSLGEVIRCPCQSGKPFAKCHGADGEEPEANGTGKRGEYEKILRGDAD